TRVSYDQVPVRVVCHVKPAGQGMGLAAVTAAIEVSSENYVPVSEGLWQAQTNIYGRVTDLVGQVVFEFDDDLTSRSEGDPAKRSQSHRFYQKKLLLKPGRYKLNLVAREGASKKLGTVESLILDSPESHEL